MCTKSMLDRNISFITETYFLLKDTWSGRIVSIPFACCFLLMLETTFLAISKE